MRKKLAAFLLCTIPLLIGCAASQDTSSMTIKKDGVVKSYIVEEFTAPYYDEYELQQSAEADILAYNDETGEDAIELKKFKLEEGILRATVEYQTSKDYESFNEETLFVGLLSEAEKDGYDVEGTFYAADDLYQKLTYEEIQKEGDYHVVIFTEPVNVKVADKVIYISDGLQKGNSAKEVSITDDTKEIYYIIYE